jgi:hypothetical protein
VMRPLQVIQRTREGVAQSRSSNPAHPRQQQLGNEVLFLMPSSHIKNQGISPVIDLNLTKESVALLISS